MNKLKRLLFVFLTIFVFTIIISILTILKNGREISELNSFKDFEALSIFFVVFIVVPLIASLSITTVLNKNIPTRNKAMLTIVIFLIYSATIYYIFDFVSRPLF
ncbi:MAG: hypothetical protein Q8Q23_04435 [bacterium]|nr:hypothetical protein [bacterium]